jgi:hypothetical protein
MTKPSSWHHALHHMQIRIEFNRRKGRSSPSLFLLCTWLTASRVCSHSHRAPDFFLATMIRALDHMHPEKAWRIQLKRSTLTLLDITIKINRKRNVPRVGVSIPLRGLGRVSRFSHIHALHDGHAVTAGNEPPSLLVCCIMLVLLHLVLPSSQAAYH